MRWRDLVTWPGAPMRCLHRLSHFFFLFPFSSSPLPLVAGDDSSSASCWEKFSPPLGGELNHRPWALECAALTTELLGWPIWYCDVGATAQAQAAAWPGHHHWLAWHGRLGQQPHHTILLNTGQHTNWPLCLLHNTIILHFAFWFSFIWNALSNSDNRLRIRVHSPFWCLLSALETSISFHYDINIFSFLSFWYLLCLLC